MWCGAVEFEIHKSLSKEVIPNPNATSGDKNRLIVFMLRENQYLFPVHSSHKENTQQLQEQPHY